MHIIKVVYDDDDEDDDDYYYYYLYAIDISLLYQARHTSGRR